MDKLRSSPRPDLSTVALLEKIASQPQAKWFGSWSRDIEVEVYDYVSKAVDEAGALPVLVAYYIPNLNCQPGAGAKDASEYKRWIREFADGIGTRPAVVILEPDALTNLVEAQEGDSECRLSSADQETRVALLSDAVNVLKGKPKVAVYIDAGHSGWKQSPLRVARALQKVGIEKADGFSLNVSNFMHTRDEIRYGRLISKEIGGKHFVIDTSRNGRGPTEDLATCNPPGRALGTPPITARGDLTPTEDPLVDAYLWIKRPGESDGKCHPGDLEAGEWMRDYAIDLIERAEQ